MKQDQLSLENFLKVGSWFDITLSFYRKEELEYEEDKEEINNEILRIKELIFKLNSNDQGILRIEDFESVLRCDGIASSTQFKNSTETKTYMHLLFE